MFGLHECTMENLTIISEKDERTSVSEMSSPTQDLVMESEQSRSSESGMKQQILKIQC